ncbi:ATP-binding protein [Streptomyces sp. NPDC007205]|uniref:ATP-binding protein n=1 Tax=Streptomyces sp. NPDC007205 TaxID=3154316 RepID=UPI0034086D07
MPSVHGGEIVASVIPSAPLGTDTAGRPGLGAATAAPQRGTAERRFRFELAAHPRSVTQARRLAHARLTGWSVCADTCDSAALVISELVTNAIVHTASSRVVCELHDHDDTVRIAVRDEGCAPGEPHPSPQRTDEEHGRGLLLVDALCRAWGVQEHGPGLLVWAELARRTDTARDTAEPCNDLGWGARPKPGRPDDPDEDEPPEGRRRLSGQPPQRAPEQRPPHGVPEQQHQRGVPEPHRHRALDRPPHQPQHRAPEQHRAGERP